MFFVNVFQYTVIPCSLTKYIRMITKQTSFDPVVNLCDVCHACKGSLAEHSLFNVTLKAGSWKSWIRMKILFSVEIVCSLFCQLLSTYALDGVEDS